MYIKHIYIIYVYGYIYIHICKLDMKIITSKTNVTIYKIYQKYVFFILINNKNICHYIHIILRK